MPASLPALASVPLRFLDLTQEGPYANDRLVYDRSSGNLYWDADGSGAGAKLLFAVLENKPALDAGDFIVI